MIDLLRWVVAKGKVSAFFLVISSVLLWPIVYAGQVPYWGGTLLQFYPWRKLVAEMFRGGQLPLWNPYLGLGAPLAANLQSAVFYPLNLLFLLFPVERALGYANVLHMALAGLGVYLFCRELKVSQFAGLIGGLTYMLSGFVVARLIFPGHVDAMVWLPFILYAVEMVVQAAIGLPGTGSLRRRVVLGTLLLALLLFAGHMQVAFYSAWVIAAYALVRVLQVAYQAHRTPQALPRRPALRSLLCLVAMALLGVGLAAVQLLLTGELALASARAAETNRDFMLMYSLRPWQLVNILAPDSFGNPATSTYWGPGNYWEGAAYIGILPLLLAFSGLRHRRQRGLLLFFALLALVALLLSLGYNTPLYLFLFDHVPGFSLFQAPTRILFLYVLAMAVLAAFGADRVFVPFAHLAKKLAMDTLVEEDYDADSASSLSTQSSPKGRGSDPPSPRDSGEKYGSFPLSQRVERTVPLPLKEREEGPSPLSLWERVSVRVSSPRAKPQLHPELSERQPLQGSRLIMLGLGITFGALAARFVSADWLGVRVSIVDGLWRFGILLALSGLVLALRMRLSYRWVCAAALLLLLGDLLPVDIPLNPATEAAVYTLPASTAQYLAQAASFSRIFTPQESFTTKFFSEVHISNFGSNSVAEVMQTREKLIPNLPAAEHLYEVYNYDPLQVEDVNALHLAIERAGFPEGALAALNVSYILSDTAPSPRFSAPIVVGPNKLYPVSPTLPRAYLVTGSTVVPSHAEALRALISPTFQPTTTVILEQNQTSLLAGVGSGGKGNTPDGAAFQGGAEILEYAAQRVLLRTSAPQPSFLVLSDTYYPGWQAKVDGRSVPILRANYALRAVPLPAGEHDVAFFYDPPLFRIGVIVSGFSILVGLALLLQFHRRFAGNHRLVPQDRAF